MPGPFVGSFVRLVLGLAVFLVVGGPAVYFFWRELSDLLYGRFGDVQLLILVPATVVFVAVLMALAAYARRLESTDREKESV